MKFYENVENIIFGFSTLVYLYSGTCLIRHSFGQEKCVGLPNCRIRRVKMHSKTLICVEILSDPENSGLYRFHCISIWNLVSRLNFYKLLTYFVIPNNKYSHQRVINAKFRISILVITCGNYVVSISKLSVRFRFPYHLHTSPR